MGAGGPVSYWGTSAPPAGLGMAGPAACRPTQHSCSQHCAGGQRAGTGHSGRAASLLGPCWHLGRSTRRSCPGARLRTLIPGTGCPHQPMASLCQLHMARATVPPGLGECCGPTGQPGTSTPLLPTAQGHSLAGLALGTVPPPPPADSLHRKQTPPRQEPPGGVGTPIWLGSPSLQLRHPDAGRGLGGGSQMQPRVAPGIAATPGRGQLHPTRQPRPSTRGSSPPHG